MKKLLRHLALMSFIASTAYLQATPTQNLLRRSAPTDEISLIRGRGISITSDTGKDRVSGWTKVRPECISRGAEDEDLFTVELKYAFDPDLNEPYGIAVYSHEAEEVVYAENYRYDPEPRINLPAGVYDLIAIYTIPRSEMFYKTNIYNFVIREGIEIDSDSEFTLDISEATECVSFTACHPSGEELRLSSLDSEGNSANPNLVVGVTSSTEVFLKGLQTLFLGGDSFQDMAEYGFEPMKGQKIYISPDVSDRYMFVRRWCMLADVDGVIQPYMAQFAFSGSNAGEMVIDLEDIATDAVSYTPTPLADMKLNNFGDVPSIAYSGKTFFPDLGFAGNGFTTPFYAKDNTITYNLGQKYFGISDRRDYIIAGMQPQFMEALLGEYFIEEEYGVFLPYIFNDDNERYYSIYTSQFNPSVLSPVPGDSDYSFTESQKGIEFASSAPLNMCYTMHDEFDGQRNVWYLETRPVGITGEERSSDVLTMDLDVSFNGEPVYELGELQDGDYEFILTDNNVVVDGIQGRNVSRMGFNSTLEDWDHPILSMYQIRDTESKVTNKLKTPSDGILVFTGFDTYTTFVSDDDIITEFQPLAEVKLEYAPYNSDEWAALDFDRDRVDYKHFGEYFKASLEGVDRYSENGWFDLRISIEDPSGNYQVQTISPAFYIDELSGIAPIFGDAVGENCRIYNIHGIRLEQPQPGLNIVRYENGQTLKVFVK